MRISDIRKDSIVTIDDILLSEEKIVRRLSEIGVKTGQKIRFIRRSMISKCVLIETLGSVFILDKNVADGIVCHE